MKLRVKEVHSRIGRDRQLTSPWGVDLASFKGQEFLYKDFDQLENSWRLWPSGWQIPHPFWRSSESTIHGTFSLHKPIYISNSTRLLPLPHFGLCDTLIPNWAELLKLSSFIESGCLFLTNSIQSWTTTSVECSFRDSTQFLYLTCQKQSLPRTKTHPATSFFQFTRYHLTRWQDQSHIYDASPYSNANSPALASLLIPRHFLSHRTPILRHQLISILEVNSGAFPNQ